MRKMLKLELEKLLASKLFWLALLAGIIIGEAQAVNNISWIERVHEFSRDNVHPSGLSSISLLIRWLGYDSYTVLGILFYSVLPLLAAIPFGGSGFREQKSGYYFQIITRCGRKKYLLAKGAVTFLSGAVTIGLPLLLNLMTNALICPLGSVPVLSFNSPIQGYFCSTLFYTHPVAYMLLELLLGMVWGGVCALMALAFGSFLKNRIIIGIAPLITMHVLSILSIEVRSAFGFKALELSPLYLMQSVTLNPNPAWLVALYVVVFTVILFVVYWKRGMRREGI